MSQVVYTELEGQPLRWVYKGTVPRESRQEADRTPKTWSVSTTSSTQIQNSSTGVVNVVYSSNMLSQHFTTPANVIKATGIQLYGRKAGSPPNPLYVELRRAEVKRYYSNARIVNFDLGTTGEKTLLSMDTALPAGGKNVIICVLLPNANLDTGARGTFRIYKGSTLLYETKRIEGFTWGGQRAKPKIVIAVDDTPSGNDSYTFKVNVTTTGSSGIVHVQGIVIKTNDVVWAYNTSAVPVAGGATSTILSTNTNFPAGSKVAVIAAVSGDANSTDAVNALLGAGNVKLKSGTNVVSSNQFNQGSWNALFTTWFGLAYLDTTTSSSQTYSVEVTNGSTIEFLLYANMVAFTVQDGAFLDTGSVALTNGSAVTVGNLSTTLSGNVVAIALASAENTSTSFVTAFNAGDVVLQLNDSAIGRIVNAVGWHIEPTGYSGRSGILPIFRYDTNVSNPSYQLKMTARATGINGEVKILVFPAQAQVFGYEVWTGETVLSTASISPASVSTTDAWFNIPLSAIALRPNENFVIVVYTIGGDASNHYVIHSSSITLAFPYMMVVTLNSGATWQSSNEQVLSFKLDGVQYVRLYSGAIPNNIVTPLGKVIAALIIKAQTSSSMEFAGFDDHTYTAPVVSSNASSQTFITVLKPEDPRLRSVPPSDTLNWSIWAAGSGLSTGAYTQRHTYYTANPVYPKDFGFGELYLTADEIPPQGLVVLNDNTAAALYNPTAETKKTTYELFRIPVRKIEVIQEPTSGNIILYLIGIP